MAVRSHARLGGWVVAVRSALESYLGRPVVGWRGGGRAVLGISFVTPVTSHVNLCRVVGWVILSEGVPVWGVILCVLDMRVCVHALELRGCGTVVDACLIHLGGSIHSERTGSGIGVS